ncbi:MAG: glycosyltransferase family 4 protein, partial [Chlamydiia bacterium]|nr:glycosyltransferase family 4 protein [Chlamydiia bacterium]
PYITLTGPIKMADGIGRQLVELAEVLIDDFDLTIRSHHIEKEDVPRKIRRLLREQYKKYTLRSKKIPLGKVVISEETLWVPGEDIKPRHFKTTTQDDQIRIAYSMLEFTQIPAEWVMQLNVYYDAVAVPDPFLVDVYKASGVRIPIFELPLGVNLQPFLNTPFKKHHGTPMVFANFSSTIDRKNQLTLVRAFAKALGNVDDAVLHLNSRGGDPKVREELVQEIAKLSCSNIRFTEFSLRRDAYTKLFQDVDCYVSLSKGEGFSIQPREALALGIPVIATNNTGQITICKNDFVKAIESALQEQVIFYSQPIPGGYQFNCEVDDVANAIYDVYNNYPFYLQKATLGKEWASHYDFSDTTLRNMYKTLVKPKKLILGKENKIGPDYLITNSKKLFEKYKAISKPIEISIEPIGEQ